MNIYIYIYAPLFDSSTNCWSHSCVTDLPQSTSQPSMGGLMMTDPFHHYRCPGPRRAWGLFNFTWFSSSAGWTSFLPFILIFLWIFSKLISSIIYHISCVCCRLIVAISSQIQVWNDLPYTVFDTETLDSSRVQSTVGCFPELCFRQFSVAQVLVELRMQFMNNFAVPTWVCAPGFNNYNNDCRVSFSRRQCRRILPAIRQLHMSNSTPALYH